MKTELKRQNFNITPEQEAEISWLKDAIAASSVKDAILWAVRVITTLARETKQGRVIYVGDESGAKERLLIPELEGSPVGQWTYLVERPHPWRRQRYIKGRRLLASTVWTDMLTNGMSRKEAADNWGLPIEAIDEAIRYCEQNQTLLRMEEEEDRRRLMSKGVEIGH